jgi:hypothetical protein
VFSLGSLLWELATSKIPFSGLPDDLTVIAAELNKPEPKLALFGYVLAALLWSGCTCSWLRV